MKKNPMQTARHGGLAGAILAQLAGFGMKIPAPRSYTKKVSSKPASYYKPGTPPKQRTQAEIEHINRMSDRSRMIQESLPPKQEADPYSITSIKLRKRCHRNVARMVKRAMEAEGHGATG